jgi:hypothetical protein
MRRRAERLREKVRGLNLPYGTARAAAGETKDTIMIHE